ncbi:hypothetical protein SDC9_77120 [bioreactor metagenome]|uniref:Uncharacterized protein n=1 Tax=bioreactor metagenome TaxID=1076179 RepID=A0A644YQ27_9ZZZZ
MLEQDRHADVGQLGHQHKRQRRQHAPLVAQQIWHQAAQRLPVIGAGGLGCR